MQDGMPPRVCLGMSSPQTQHAAHAYAHSGSHPFVLAYAVRCQHLSALKKVASACSLPVARGSLAHRARLVWTQGVFYKPMCCIEQDMYQIYWIVC